MDVDTGQKNKLLYISIILSVLVFVNANHKQCYEEKDGNMIEKAYDPLTHICCGGSVVPKNGIDRVCCSGKTVFNKELEMCCGNKTYELTTQGGQNKGCCGNTPFVDDGSSFCCGNKILYKSTGDNEDCCGVVKIDTSRKTCCTDELYNTATHSIRLNHECCGTHYYNKTSHRCVQGNVVPKERAHYKMCGETEYNTKLNSCCHGKIYMGQRTKYDECCGSQKYNRSNEKCCDRTSGHVIPSDYMCCGSGFATRSQRCCQDDQVLNATTTTQECCGHNLYDPANGEGCCMTSQNGAYDKSTMKCCSGNIVPKDAGCCGDGTFNQATSVCCNEDYAILKQEPDHNKCCPVRPGVGKSYNNAVDRCIARGGVSIVEPRAPMCGTLLFHPGTDLCCGMKLYSNAAKSGLKCCIPGTMAFNPSTELCCNSMVYSRSITNSCDGVDTVDTNIRDDYNDDDYDDILNRDVIDDDDISDDDGTCQICGMDASEATRKIKQGEIDVCRNSANKFNVKKERPTRQYQFLGMNMVNIYGGKKVRQAQRVHIPCNCRINWKQVIIITDKPSRKSKLFLDERDIVLPYTREVKRQMKKVHKSKCKHKTDVKELLNDLKVYLLQIQLKVDKLENKVMNKS